jgi:hypothetical protein
MECVYCASCALRLGVTRMNGGGFYDGLENREGDEDPFPVARKTPSRPRFSFEDLVSRSASAPSPKVFESGGGKMSKSLIKYGDYGSNSSTNRKSSRFSIRELVSPDVGDDVEFSQLPVSVKVPETRDFTTDELEDLLYAEGEGIPPEKLRMFLKRDELPGVYDINLKMLLDKVAILKYIPRVEEFLEDKFSKCKRAEAKVSSDSEEIKKRVKGLTVSGEIDGYDVLQLEDMLHDAGVNIRLIHAYISRRYRKKTPDLYADDLRKIIKGFSFENLPVVQERMATLFKSYENFQEEIEKYTLAIQKLPVPHKPLL